MRSIGLVLLLPLFVTNVWCTCPAFLKNQSACSCFDSIDGVVIRCTGQNGPSIVEKLKKLPMEIRELALENANIVEIGRQAFKNLRIKKLVLDNNRIRALHADAFHGLESVMTELSISHNKLTQIPTDSLTAMRMLSVLSLKCNNIGNLKNSAFINMPSLIDLNLGCNQICEIGGTVFENVQKTLQNLILDNNCLSEIPTDALSNLENLIGLHMKYNQIDLINTNQLTNMSSLTILSLTGNKINQINKDIMPEADNLRYLYLGSNNLSSIESGVLRQFSQVQVIDLSYNNFEAVTDDMFSGLEHLQHLNLEGNQINDIAPGAFATTPLLLLWLPNNCLDLVSPNMFQGAPFLRQVSLAGNNIRTVQPLSFAHLANLHTLDLSHNKIQVLEPGAIIGSDYLTVRLQENPMVCLQDGFHVMNGKEAINLTTEPNLICKTNYSNDQENVCIRKNIPTPEPCCSKAIPQTHEHTDISDETITLSPTPSPTTVPTLIQQNTHKKKFNLDRFLRLSQRPAGYHTSPFLRHQTLQSSPVNTAILNVNKKTAIPADDRPMPSRVEQRQKQLAKIRAQLPPFIRTEAKNKEETVEFVSDSQVDTVSTQERRPN